MPSFCYQKHRSRSGQAGLFVVLSLSVVLATVGLAVDVGWAYYTKQSAQTAADAAAMAAAAAASAGGRPACGTAITCNTTASGCPNPPTTPPVTDSDVGCLYAKANGFVNDTTTQWVSMAGNLSSNAAPPGTTGNTPTYWTQANVTVKPFTLFGSFGGVSRFTINASSTAAVSYYGAGACIYIVHETASNAFVASGGSTTRATCGIFINSNSSTGFAVSGSASVRASQILINANNYSTSGVPTLVPSPTLNAGPQPDPLSTQTLPTFTNGPCPAANKRVVEGGVKVDTLGPDIYCGDSSHIGITISNSANITFSGGTYIINDGLSIGGSATVKFMPGVYIINGTGLSIGNSATVTGTGVTFFITGQPYPVGTAHTIGPVSLTGSGTVNLAAPTSGTYQGMLFLQDRALSYTTANSFANSASAILQGTLYFPTTTLNYSGASTTGSYTAIVANKMQMTGSANFLNDPTGIYTGLATTVRGLIQ